MTEYILSGMKSVMTCIGLLLFFPKGYVKKEYHLKQNISLGEYVCLDYKSKQYLLVCKGKNLWRIIAQILKSL